ncbi:hypothetical protein Enr10x_14180 [Gimesia panareensis]|uniref:Uncharacterized protein n=1 Tax=Gimesia panareensis TaxID=2527978 RepID=A0A517Q3D2_9PLAN|nr:hypothetical protein Enr10x_14180 [Gimesia panareensis]
MIIGKLVLDGRGIAPQNLQLVADTGVALAVEEDPAGRIEEIRSGSGCDSGVVDNQCVIAVAAVEGEVGDAAEVDHRTGTNLVGPGINPRGGNRQDIVSRGSSDGQAAGKIQVFDFIEDDILERATCRDRPPVQTTGCQVGAFPCGSQISQAVSRHRGCSGIPADNINCRQHIGIDRDIIGVCSGIERQVFQAFITERNGASTDHRANPDPRILDDNVIAGRIAGIIDDQFIRATITVKGEQAFDAINSAAVIEATTVTVDNHLVVVTITVHIDAGGGIERPIEVGYTPNAPVSISEIEVHTDRRCIRNHTGC